MAKDQPKNQPQPIIKEEQRKEASTALSEVNSNSQKSLFGIDYYLISTISLAVISLCALFVSIYQTNVLSGQQEVMDEQQKIMRSQQELMQKNARAQLWPRIRVTGNESFKDGKLIKLQFGLTNEGTGPAIIDYVALGYNGNYTTAWYDLFFQAGLLDSIPFIIDSQPINNRVLQSGERITYLSLGSSPLLMNRVYQDNKEGKGLELVICYRSVFEEHWVLDGKVGDIAFTAPTPTDSCTVDDKPLFLN